MCAAPSESQSAQAACEGSAIQNNDGYPQRGAGPNDKPTCMNSVNRNLNKICVFVLFVPQVPEEVFEEVLLSALQTDLASAFSTPEQLQLLLVALHRFPQTLKPKKLKKLLGSSTIINKENIPKYDHFSCTVTCLCSLVPLA